MQREQREQPRQLNVNTVLLTIVLAVSAWMGKTVQESAITLAVVVQKTSSQELITADLRNRVQKLEYDLIQYRKHSIND